MNTEHKPARHSIRLQGYDYSEPGEYYITIATYARRKLFGEVIDNEMRLNKFGQIAYTEWLKTPTIRPQVELGAFIIMPNHFHAIVHFLDHGQDKSVIDIATLCRGVQLDAPTERPRLLPRTLASLVAGYKSSVTMQVNTLRNTPRQPVWQRNYYEHIICSNREYETIDAYISSNPENWLTDTEFR